MSSREHILYRAEIIGHAQILALHSVLQTTAHFIRATRLSGTRVSHCFDFQFVCSSHFIADPHCPLSIDPTLFSFYPSPTPPIHSDFQ